MDLKYQAFSYQWKISAVVLIFVTGALAAEFQIKNNSPNTIWIGILGGNNKPPLANGGFSLNGYQQTSVYSPDDWEGRFWARTGCNPSNNHCETGDCGNKLQCSGAGGVPPVTLVEIKLRGSGGQDFYDISLVDGFNVKSSISPINGQGDCRSLACQSNLNPNCPNELKQYAGSGLVACYSACMKYNTDQYCCRGAYNGPNKCNPNTWPVNSARYFKQNCPDAYSYAYDDQSSLKTCRASAYKITFG